jgi:hypothetical protein
VSFWLCRPNDGTARDRRHREVIPARAAPRGLGLSVMKNAATILARAR